ncbi:MAG: TIM-barrel domain-containing protein, partial [Polyangiaceae bacterium]
MRIAKRQGRHGFALRAVALTGAVLLATGFDCGSGDTSGIAGVPATTTWSTPTGNAKVIVTANPFSFAITDAAGNTLLESSGVTDDPAYGSLAYTHNVDESGPTIIYGWDYYRGEDNPFSKAKVHGITATPGALTIAFAGDGDDAHSGSLTFGDSGINGGIRILASVAHSKGGADTDETAINRVSLSFKMHDDDHFLGFGERAVYTDERGQKMKTWVEEDGFGHGENEPISASNPSPNGPDMTHVPVPWLLSPRGFGLFQNTISRVNYHLGDERPDAWRVEATTGTFDAVLFIDPEPAKLIEDLTAITGRPPPISDWFLAPRRRANIGTDEMEKLRAAHIPTTSIDTAFHYFPNGLGTTTHDQLKAITADIHARGFKAISYFCPFVADTAHPEFDEAVAGGFLVKHADGTTYTMLDTPHNAGIVDFTNPAAVKWFQDKMQGAIDDGWDGWMYDFAEYVPMDAVMFNGMLGIEAHNIYTNLYQKAAMDIVGPDRLIFVRSGYSGSTGNGSIPMAPIAGTGGLVPMLWAGDQSTDFGLAQGLPSALINALDSGLSGLPLWSSDISGYHYIYNPPPDKELYLRWTELGAFSVDMHDENEGAGSSPSSDRWQIWKDQESQDVYRKYASLKTRMIPYLQVAVNEARATGMPVMRHLVIGHAKDPKVYAIADEYMFGDSLLVAPVVKRGLTTRSVYLPDAAYYDFWTGARVAGHTDVMANAPLDTVPIYALEGAIVPMLDPAVESLYAATVGTPPIPAAVVASRMEVRIFAGNSSQITLSDGTTFSQDAPAENPNVAAPT